MLHPAAVLLLALVVAGALLVIGWFLPWVYDGPVPARAPDVEADDAIGFTVPLVAGALAVVLGALALAGRGLRTPLPWLALVLLAAGALGAVIAFLDATDGADYNAGLRLTAVGSLVVLGLAIHRTYRAGTDPPRPRIGAGDVVAAVGGLIVLYGTTRVESVIGPLAVGPTAVAGLLAIVALALRAAPGLRGSRLLALAAAAAGPLALGAAGMAEMHGRPWIVLGGLLMTAGGALALWARSGLR